uniref:Uncharacterized protein n=1 Tax=Neovison vison TaxID=452646 RepID=A0A8C7AZW8_NEOVI
MQPGRASGNSGRLRAAGRRSLHPLPAVCEVSGRTPGASFAGSVPEVRRRRLPGLGTARAAARGRLQISDPREPWFHASAIWAPSLLHIYDRPSHSLCLLLVNGAIPTCCVVRENQTNKQAIFPFLSP